MITNTTLLLLLFVFFIHFIDGQRAKDIMNFEVKGIYLSCGYFKGSKLICSADNQHKNGRVKLKQFFISPEISCVEPEKGIIFYQFKLQ